jgi:hypothetical protein
MGIADFWHSISLKRLPMLMEDYLNLKELFSPEVLWEIRPTRLVGKVHRKRDDGRTGYIKPQMEIVYPDGQIMDRIFSAELDEYSEGDFVIFSMRDSKETEKIKWQQKNLQQAYNVEFATDEDIESLTYEFNPAKIASLGRRLKELNEDLDEQRLTLQHEVKRKVAEQLKTRIEEMDNLEKTLKELQTQLQFRELELDEREQKIEQTVAEKVAEQKLALDIREAEINSRSRKLNERASTLKVQKESLEGERQQLARAHTKFQEEGGEKFTEFFSMLENEDTQKVAVATDAIPPRNLPREIKSYLKTRGFAVDEAVSAQFLLSTLSAALTGQFVVLSGPTGVGKTSMVNMFASALGAGYGVVPVRPSWIDPTDLLGFYNPQIGRYQASPFMDRFLEAGQYTEANRLYFLTLDEMNLSRVENYAADFLSRLEKARAGESEANLSLYSNDIERQLKLEIERLKNSDDKDLRSFAFTVNHLSKYPSSVKIPTGLVLFGTINLDETTHHLSPKFLDRAFVIKIPAQELVENITDISGVDPQNKPFFDLSLNTVKNLFENEKKIPAVAQKIWEDVLSWQEEYIQPLGIRLGFRFSQMYVTFMKLAANLGIEPRAAASVFFQAKLFPWISFHQDEKVAGDEGQTKLQVLQNWSEDASLADYPEGFGLQSALQRVVERVANSVVVRYLE